MALINGQKTLPLKDRCIDSRNIKNSLSFTVIQEKVTKSTY